MDAVKIYQSGSFRVNFTNNSNSSSIDYRAIFDDYSMIETLDFWPQQVIFIVLYSTIAIVSFLVNFVTIVVLVKCDKICSELYFYLINLSVSDIVMSLFW